MSAHQVRPPSWSTTLCKYPYVDDYIIYIQTTITLSKYKFPLPDIVHPREQAHAYQHGHVFLQRPAAAFQKCQCTWFCYAVGQQIAYCNVDGKADSALHHLSFMPESERLVHHVTENAYKYVVCCAGYPVRCPCQVV